MQNQYIAFCVWNVNSVNLIETAWLYRSAVVFLLTEHGKQLFLILLLIGNEALYVFVVGKRPLSTFVL